MRLSLMGSVTGIIERSPAPLQAATFGEKGAVMHTQGLLRCALG